MSAYRSDEPLVLWQLKYQMHAILKLIPFEGASILKKILRQLQLPMVLSDSNHLLTN